MGAGLIYAPPFPPCLAGRGAELKKGPYYCLDCTTVINNTATTVVLRTSYVDCLLHMLRIMYVHSRCMLPNPQPFLPLQMVLKQKCVPSTPSTRIYLRTTIALNSESIYLSSLKVQLGEHGV